MAQTQYERNKKCLIKNPNYKKEYDAKPSNRERIIKCNRCWQSKHKDHIKNLRLLNRYGISQRQYNDMFVKMGKDKCVVQVVVDV